MTLRDVFEKEDRVQVTFTDFYNLMRDRAKAEFIMNAVKNNVPNKYIVSMLDIDTEEKKEDTP